MPEVDAFDKHEGPEGRQTAVVDIDVGRHQGAIDPEVVFKRQVESARAATMEKKAGRSGC